MAWPKRSTVFRFNVTHESSYALKLNANDDFFAVAVLNRGLKRLRAVLISC